LRDRSSPACSSADRWNDRRGAASPNASAIWPAAIPPPRGVSRRIRSSLVSCASAERAARALLRSIARLFKKP
jgi:hypothetical protein